ncbi:hypothetical protein QTN25_001029 [Entamoeba marina]
MNNLCRVEVYKSPTCKQVGPLETGCIVDTDVVGILVRETCINASKSFQEVNADDKDRVAFIERSEIVMNTIDKKKKCSQTDYAAPIHAIVF